jgi:hypothetical protein
MTLEILELLRLIDELQIELEFMFWMDNDQLYENLKIFNLENSLNHQDIFEINCIW